MIYLNATTLEYPFYEGDVALNPDFDWVEVQTTAIPICESDEIVEELAPTLIDGVWVQTFAIRKKNETEIAEANALPKYLLT